MFSVLSSMARVILWSTVIQSFFDSNHEASLLDRHEIPGGSPLRYCNVSRDTDLYSFEHIELYPNPLYIDDVFEVHLYGEFLKNITNNATFTGLAQYGNSTEYETFTFDFCGSMESIDQPDPQRKKECPPEKGFALIMMSAWVWPNLIPPGPYYFKFDAVTQEEERIYCLEAHIHLDYKEEQ